LTRRDFQGRHILVGVDVLVAKEEKDDLALGKEGWNRGFSRDKPCFDRTESGQKQSMSSSK
jgi:hypothetical protein